jgi:hypothetical protein
MRTCQTSGCDSAAKNGGLCAECLSREYPMLEEMTRKAVLLELKRKPVVITKIDGLTTVKTDGHTGLEIVTALHAFDRRLERQVVCTPDGDVIVRGGGNFAFVGQR